MVKYLISLLLTLTLPLSSLELCGEHFSQIRKIREVASYSILECNQNGGRILHPSLVSFPEDSAWDLVRWRKTYSDFSMIFRELISICQPKGMDYLLNGYSHVGDMFYNLYTECIAKHSSIQARYERSRIYFDRGLYQDCLSDIQCVVESGQWDQLKAEDKKNLEDPALLEGAAYFELGVYDRTIEKLSELIEHDPTNKQAYYHSALACFETGDFDRAIQRYLESAKSKSFSKIKLQTSSEFKEGVLRGIVEGATAASVEFFPSLAHSAYGLGRILWDGVKAINHPVNTTTNFINACKEIGAVMKEYYQNIDLNEIQEQFGSEFQNFCQNYDRLSDIERGNLMGYVVGKYGVDIFAGATTLKMISAFKKLKEATRVSNLEVMATSNANKEAVVTSALKHSSDREKFFKNVKIEWDKQNKHVPGKHNYEEGTRSIFEHKDAQSLIEKFAGRGIASPKSEIGQVGYKEIVDFGEHIGYYINLNNSEKIPTTKGIIHYSKNGAHIIPAHPESKLFYRN